MRDTLIAGIVVSRRADSRLVIKDILTIAGLPLSVAGRRDGWRDRVAPGQGKASEAAAGIMRHCIPRGGEQACSTAGGSTSSYRTLLNA